MPSQPRPQSKWLRSFILFSILACASLAALGFLGVFIVRRVSNNLQGQGTASITTTDVRPNVSLPTVTLGWDNITTNLLSAFDSVDVIALGESKGRKMDSELRLRLVRNPDFPFRAHLIIVEFANSLYQSTLDKYIYGDNVPMEALENVWWNDSPVYAEFLAAVREVNAKLPPDRRVRVIAGDVPIDWDKVKTKEDLVPLLLRRAFPVSVDGVIVPRGEKALVIYSNTYVKRPAFPLEASNGEPTVDDPGDVPLPTTTPPMFKALQAAGPGRVFVVETIAGLNLFEKTLQFGELPALIPLTGMHSAVGSGIDNEADACVYFGDTREANASATADAAAWRGTALGTELARRQKILDSAQPN